MLSLPTTNELRPGSLVVANQLEFRCIHSSITTTFLGFAPELHMKATAMAGPMSASSKLLVHAANNVTGYLHHR